MQILTFSVLVNRWFVGQVHENGRQEQKDKAVKQQKEFLEKKCGRKASEIIGCDSNVLEKKKRTKNTKSWILRIYRGFWDLGRFIQIAFYFMPCTVIFPIFYFLQTNETISTFWYNLLVSSLQRSGPTFIKLGQWASTRADIFNAELF